MKKKGNIVHPLTHILCNNIIVGQTRIGSFFFLRVCVRVCILVRLTHVESSEPVFQTKIHHHSTLGKCTHKYL